MKENLTQTVQDYLKTIYDLQENTGSASTTALAARLGIAPASVTGMLQRLASGITPLVDYRKHQGVTLTPAGKRAALEVIRHHRLLETYLVETLGYPWDKVHAEADQLEHFISEDFEARIAAALGNPTRDPHGELIPTVDLVMPSDPAIPLASLTEPQKVIIQRVGADNPDLLRHMQNLGLVPGAMIEIVRYSNFDRNISLQVADQQTTIVIGEAISTRIFVLPPTL